MTSLDEMAERLGLKFTDVTGKALTLQRISADSVVYGIWHFIYHKGDWVLNGIYRDGFLKLCSELHYYIRFSDDDKSYQFIKDDGGVITSTQTVHLKDEIFSPENINLNDIQFTIGNEVVSFNAIALKETYLKQYHNLINSNFLEHLETHTKPVLKDSKDITYLFFKNTILEITKDSINPLPYSILDERGVCIWREYIIPHNIDYSKDGFKSEFAKFIKNVSANDSERTNSFKSAIGYLINGYKSQANVRAVICYDEEPTDLRNPQGGTGKGVFANGLKQVRNIITIDGKKFDPDSQFRWQRVNDSTQIVWIDDASTKVPFDVFHSVLAEGWNIERKHKEEQFIPPEQSPNLLLTSNTIIQGDGNTNERRQFILEFAPYYKELQVQGIKEPIVQEHGGLFFGGWNRKQWNLFFSYMADCSQYYLNNGLTFYEQKSVNKNKLIQGTSIDFYEWITEAELEIGKPYDLKEQFECFKQEQGLDEVKQNTFTKFLKKYCSIEDIELVKKSSNSKTYFTLKSVKV